MPRIEASFTFIYHLHLWNCRLQIWSPKAGLPGVCCWRWQTHVPMNIPVLKPYLYTIPGHAFDTVALAVEYVRKESKRALCLVVIFPRRSDRYIYTCTCRLYEYTFKKYQSLSLYILYIIYQSIYPFLLPSFYIYVYAYIHKYTVYVHVKVECRKWWSVIRCWVALFSGDPCTQTCNARRAHTRCHKKCQPALGPPWPLRTSRLLWVHPLV